MSECRHVEYCPFPKGPGCKEGSCAVGDIRAESYLLSGVFGPEVQQRARKTLGLVILTEEQRLFLLQA